MRKLLFCGNGMSGEIIPALSKEYDIAVITEFIDDKGLESASKVYQANSKVPQEALHAAKIIWNNGFKFEAVLSLCWDCPESVSLIADYFNLAGLPIEIARISSDKYKRSQKFFQNNIPSPKFYRVSSIKELIQLRNRINYPIVLKPLNLSSSKGVVRVDSDEKLIESYYYTLSFYENVEKREIIVNEFIEGIEYSVEGLMINSKLFLTGISERIFEYEKYYPNFVEVGDVIPAGLTNSQEKRVKKIVEDAALALRINNGVVKADLIKSKTGKFYVLELTPRLGGPRFGTEMIPLSNGTNLLKAYIQQLLNEEIDKNLLTPKYNKGVVNRSLLLNEGIISKVTFNNLQNIEGFYDFKWWGIKPLKEGDVVTKPKFGCGSIGYIIACGGTRSEAIKNADKIEYSIKIEIVGEFNDE